MTLPLTRTQRTSRMGPVLVGLAVLILSVFSAYGVSRIPAPLLGGPIGPRTFPLMVTAGLGICGILLVLSALRGSLRVSEEDRIDWGKESGNVAWFAFGLVLNIVLIAPVGFILASGPMFACVAHGFGSRRLLRNLVIGLVFALTVDLLFRFVLGVTIGLGTFGLAGCYLGIS
jgi:putative tricarboxylic transport membrane protein